MTALAGSVALVTGGGRGLGREAALSLAAAGMAVAVTGRTASVLDDVVAEVTASGGRALTLPGDATDRAAVAAAVQRTEDELGPLDLLVANAGRFATGGPLWQTDPDDWWRDVEVNVRSLSLCLWAALPGMVERGSGRVVALGSGFGNRPYPHASGYSVGKTAVHRLVESVAGELAGTGVVVLSVSPGFVSTDMTRGFPSAFTAAHPGFADPDVDRWTPPEAFTGLLARVAAGELDALSGRFVHVTTDLSAALRRAGEAEPGTLRTVPW